MSRSPLQVEGLQPIRPGVRNTYLDLIRGVAVLGILLMNVVSIGLGSGPYFNISAGGSFTWLDWAIGWFGEIFVDQKFMGLFSLLFGAGIALFCDRAAGKTRRPRLLSLWRNLLLLGIGILHGLLWEGDILMVYALASPIIILMYRHRPKTLLVLGSLVLMLSPITAVLLQSIAAGDGTGPGGFWKAGAEMSDIEGLYLLVDALSRSVGMMLIGVALYRTGILTGERSTAFYKRLSITGSGIGLPLAAAGLSWVAVRDYSPDVSFIGAIPNTLGTVPAVLGYVGLIVLWNRRPPSELHRRVRAVGRMALTNYLAQTVLGVLVLQMVLADAELSRTGLLGFVLAVWAAQLWWSKGWLERFAYGPAEWLWRIATYRRYQPLRRQPSRPASDNLPEPRPSREPGTDHQL